MATIFHDLRYSSTLTMWVFRKLFYEAVSILQCWALSYSSCIWQRFAKDAWCALSYGQQAQTAFLHPRPGALCVARHLEALCSGKDIKMYVHVSQPYWKGHSQAGTWSIIAPGYTSLDLCLLARKTQSVTLRLLGHSSVIKFKTEIGSKVSRSRALLGEDSFHPRLTQWDVDEQSRTVVLLSMLLFLFS